MRLEAAPRRDAFGEVLVKHGSQYIQWPTKAYEASKVKDLDNLFTPINDLLATLSDADQDSIWETYIEMWSVIEAGGGLDVLVKLQPLVKKLYDIVTWEVAFTWVVTQSMLCYPPGLHTNFDTVDACAKSRTYLRGHYTELLAFATMTKLLVPVFGILVNPIKELVDNDKKEYVTLRILKDSVELIDCPASKMLHAYIHNNFHSLANDANLIHNTISTYENTDYLFAHVIIRRISVGALLLPGESLIANVYKVLDRGAIGKGRKKVEYVKEKRASNMADAEEGERSVREGYKIKQQVAIDEIVQTEVWLDTYMNIQDIEPTVTKLLMQRCLGNISRTTELSLIDYKIQLIVAVFGGCIYNQSIRLVDRPTKNILLAGTQAVLYKWGFELLAHLVTAIDKPIDLDVIYSDSRTISSARRMRAAQQEKLSGLYPYNRKTPNSLNLKGDSPGEHTIHCFLESLSSVDLFYNSPTMIMPELEDITGRITLPPVGEIRDELIDLIIKVKGQ